MLDMVLPVLAVGGMVGVFIGLIVLVRWLGRVVHRSIEAFAAAHPSLTYAHDVLQPSCTGTFEGRALQVANELMVLPWGRDNRAIPMFVVRLSVAGAPERLWMGKAPLQGSPQPPRQALGLGELDGSVYAVVDQGTEAQARAWLSPARQAALRTALTEQSRSGIIEVQNLFLEEGQLILRMTHMKKAKAAWIEECVRELLPHAAAIEAG
jgi:hypothetical protein